MSKLIGTTALVTGANRGIGKAYVEALLDAGASRIYAASRRPGVLDGLSTHYEGRVSPVTLDVTDLQQVQETARKLGDVDLLINNAGIAGFESLIAPKKTETARTEMETNYFGTLNMVQAFAPVLKFNGGGTIVNMASVVSLVSFPAIGSYSASKAAVHSLTQAVRGELKAQGTHVVGVYPGPVDTDMGAGIEMEKASPASIARAVLQAIEAGEEDVYPDAMAQQLHQSLLHDAKAVERQVAEMMPAS